MQMHNHKSLGRANHPQGSKINKIVNICADYMNLIITMQHPYTSAYPRTSTIYSQSKSTTKYYYSTHECCLRTFNSMHPHPPSTSAHHQLIHKLHLSKSHTFMSGLYPVPHQSKPREPA